MPGSKDFKFQRFQISKFQKVFVLSEKFHGLNVVDHYFFIIIICMKKLSAPDWLKTSPSSCNTNEDCN